MANKIQMKRSAVAAKVPTTTDLDLGELGVNTNDGKVYIKKDNGTPSIVEVTGPGVAPGTSGNVLTSNGTTWTSAAPSGSSPALRVNGPFIIETDLIGFKQPGLGAATYCGEWEIFNNVNAGYVSPLSPETNHPGIARMFGTNSGYDHQRRINLPYSITVTDINTFVAVVRLTGSSNNNVRVGWTNNNANGSPTMAAFFTSTGAAWHCMTRSSGNVTDNTGPSITYNTWYELKIIRNGSGNFEFYVNGTLQFTNSTNLPTGNLECGVYCYEGNNTTNYVDIDYVGVIGKTYTQRYT